MAKGPKRTDRGTFAPGSSGNPGGKRPKSVRKDGWMNLFTGLGVYGKDKRQGGSFQAATLTFDQLLELWRGDDLAARVVETLPKEATREGWDLSIPENEDGSDESDLVSKIMAKLELLGANQKIRQGLSLERGLGGGAILLGANDGQADLTKPLNLDKVKTFDWMTVLEPREIQPIYGYADPRAPKYGEPEIFRINSRSTLPPSGGQFGQPTMEVHESRLLYFPGIRVSRYQPMASQGGWGDSNLIRMWRVLRDFNYAWGSAGLLVTEFASAVYKMKDLWEVLSTDGGEKDFAERLQAMDLAKSTINATVIDADDDYQRQQTPVSGLPDLMDRFATRLSAAADMPLTLLFGTSPGGLNATGESDIRFFYDRVASFQTEKVQPHLQQLVKILFRVFQVEEPVKWSIDFRPLWQESAKDRADAMLTQSQADHNWITDQVISAEEAADSHWGSGKWQPDIKIDFAARDKQEAATSGPVTENDLRAMGRLEPEYTPPPPPGSAQAPDDIPEPGEPAAPDPNTPPKSMVLNSDHMDDSWSEELHPRDEAGKFSAGFSTRMTGTGETKHRVTFEHPATQTKQTREFKSRAGAERWVQKRAREQEAKVHSANAKLLAQKTQAQGGVTWDPHSGGMPSQGYSVAIHGDRERKLVGKAALDADAMKSYIKDNHDVFLRDPKAQVGAWYDDKSDTWFLDTPHIERDLATAAKLGKENKQLGIYDLKRGETIHDHEYEDAIARRGKFEGRTDSAARSTGFGAGSSYHDARGNGRGDEAVPQESPRRVVRWDFDPSEDRDESGKWTAGEHLAAASAAHAKMLQAYSAGNTADVKKHANDWHNHQEAAEKIEAEARAKEAKPKLMVKLPKGIGLSPTGDELGDKPPKPGQPFVVYRLGRGTSGTLDNKNAGNAEGVVNHIIASQSDGPAPPGGFGDTISIHLVTVDHDFGGYVRMNKGSAERAVASKINGKYVYLVGRNPSEEMSVGQKGSVAYSFPEGGSWKSKSLATFKVKSAEDFLTSASDGKYKTFEQAGIKEGAKYLRQYVASFAGARTDDFEEGLHPRASNGEFSQSGGSAEGQTNRQHHEAPKLSAHAESQRPAMEAFLARHRAGFQTTKNKLTEIAVPGTAVLGRVKQTDSGLEKLDRKPDMYKKADDLWDGSGFRLNSKNIADVKANVQAIKRHFNVVEENDYIDHPKDGYRSIHLQVKDHDGLMKEVQVRTPNQDRWANWCHDVYKPQTQEQRKALVEHKDEITSYAQKMSDHYYAADKGEQPNPVPCPPILHSTFGCLD